MIRNQTIKKRLGEPGLSKPVEFGEVGAQGFLHSDPPSCHCEAGDDRDDATANLLRPF